jgi:tRNA nucleotidyltransferase/poly(A) polymerase
MTRTTPDQFMASLALPEVYRVGGSVRDELLGRRSKDSDYMVRGAELHTIQDALVAGGAKPSPLKLRDGRQAGWRAAVRGWGLIEVVLPRTERSTGPGHRDFEIVTDPNLPLAEDAVRRDFTINALYLPVRAPASGVEVTLVDGAPIADPLGVGLADLRDRAIRTTHADSFRDDPLRTLRALRFVSTLNGFNLSGGCFSQMQNHADAVTGLTDKGVSGTALDELSKLLMGTTPAQALRLARDTGVLAVILPELKPMLGFEQRSAYHSKTTDEHTFDAVQAAANMHGPRAPARALGAAVPRQRQAGQCLDRQGRPAALLRAARVELPDGLGGLHARHGDRPRDARRTAGRQGSAPTERAPRALRDDVVTLIERHMLPLHENVKPFKVRKWRAELGDDMLRDLITHRLADVIGKGGDIQDACDVLQWVEQERQRARDAGVPVNAKGLKIDGHDLKALGLDGREIGRVQKELLHEVLAQPKLNEHDWLLQRAARLA